MSLQKKYQLLLSRPNWVENPKQSKVVEIFSHLADSLVKDETRRFRFLSKPRSQGIYLYGPVGSGKSFLMHLFYENVLIERKGYFHFHRFMQYVDNQLRQMKGVVNPLHRIADELAKQYYLICIDEFMVEDVAHAMILAELLQLFSSKGIIFVATSNTPPRSLYPNGIQRERFLPAIDAICDDCRIIELNSGQDYRQTDIQLMQAYWYPMTCEQREKAQAQFLNLSEKSSKSGAVSIQRRQIPCVYQASNRVWFDFNVLCNIPRSTLDFIEISEKFGVIFLENVTTIRPDDTTRASLFIQLIDVLYERKTGLVMLSEVALNNIYPEGLLIQSFQRTYSRLREMQSLAYIQSWQQRIC